MLWLVAGFKLVRRLATKATGFAGVVEHGVLAGAGAGKLAVLFCPNFNGNARNTQAEQNQCNEYKFHVNRNVVAKVRDI